MGKAIVARRKWYVTLTKRYDLQCGEDVLKEPICYRDDWQHQSYRPPGLSEILAVFCSTNFDQKKAWLLHKLWNRILFHR